MLENKIELFEQEQRVIERINQLKNEGYTEDDMYIAVSDDKDISMLRGSTSIMITEETDSLYDKFKNFLTREDSIVDAFNKMDLDKEYRDTCYQEVKEGKILLMANINYDSKFELTEDGIMVPKDEKERRPGGTKVDRNFMGDGEEQLSDNMKRDLGFEVPEDKATERKLINEQIAEQDKSDI